MIEKDIAKQIKAGESRSTAFFLRLDGPHRVGATLCAMLNASGGTIFVGVEPNGNVVGVGEDHEEQRRALEIFLQEDISPTALFTVSTDTYGAHSILTIEVPQGQDLPYVFDGRVYVRRGKVTEVADRESLRTLVRDQSVSPDRWERRPSLDLETEDLALDRINELVSEAKRTARYDFPDNATSFDVLKRLGLSNARGYTQGCDVLFAVAPAVRHPQCRVRFVQYESDKTGSNYIDNQWFDGPLVQVFGNLMERVSSLTRLQSRFVADEPRRQDSFNYSFEALREGIVNALAHRDYASFSGGVAVSVYPDRVQIWNSGQLPKALKVTDLKRAHPSLPVNPDISHALYLVNLMERVGRGTQLIVRASAELGAPPPIWKSEPSGVTLTIFASGSKAPPLQVSLSLEDKELLSRFRPGDTFNAELFISMAQIPGRTARRMLSNFVSAGYLTRTGRARHTEYQRTTKPV